ncbi:hypothetical protein ADUPG1_012139 [Aduncisulcus paluster]|uniref:Reverse transcriptase domain-containing protein n=1 Tax=Aduncisulcus paluster TaxID=2918883 RepID=A0ABQ5JYF9_9EUKA|nr:hypothetical protein ADUPG1_012139 [Aduncisulcus paluster]
MLRRGVRLRVSSRAPFRTTRPTTLTPAIRAQVEIWLRKGILIPYESPLLTSPLFAVPKKDSKVPRIVHDLRGLNVRLPRIRLTLRAAQQTQELCLHHPWMYKLDLKSGYQLKMSERDWKLLGVEIEGTSYTLSPWHEITFHAIRRGSTSTLLTHGVPEAVIMALGTWKCRDSFQSYIEEAPSNPQAPASAPQSVIREYVSRYTESPEEIDVPPSQFSGEKLRIETITVKEVNASLKGLDSAAGPDGMTSKAARSIFPGVWTTLFNKILEMELIPAQWRHIRAQGIDKQNGKASDDLGRWRPLFIANVALRLMSAILARRMTQWVSFNQVIADYQVGFCPTNGTTLNIYKCRHRLFKKQMELIPAQWRHIRAQGIDKQNGKASDDLGRWRPLFIANVALRLMSAILARRMTQWVSFNQVIADYQVGFFPTNGTTLNIYKCRHRLFKKQVGISIDLTDAFGSVHHDLLNKVIDDLTEGRFRSFLRNITTLLIQIGSTTKTYVAVRRDLPSPHYYSISAWIEHWYQMTSLWDGYPRMSGIETQNHALCACHASMEDYRSRHHRLRDSIIESIQAIHPSIPVRAEVITDANHRPDIFVDVANPVYIEVTVTYEDSGLQQLEKVTREKRMKYAGVDSLIVLAFGHARVYLPSMIDELTEILPFSQRKSLTIMDNAAQCVLRESCKIMRRFARQQHL